MELGLLLTVKKVKHLGTALDVKIKRKECVKIEYEELEIRYTKRVGCLADSQQSQFNVNYFYL